MRGWPARRCLTRLTSDFGLLRESYIPAYGIGVGDIVCTHAAHRLEHLCPNCDYRITCPRSSDNPLAGQAWTGGCVRPLRARLSPRILGHVSARTIHRHPPPIGWSCRVRRFGDSGGVSFSATKPLERPHGAWTVGGRSIFIPDREHVYDRTVCPGGLAARFGISSPLWIGRGRGRALVCTGWLTPPSAGTGGRGVADLCMAFVSGETRSRLRGRDRPDWKRHLLDRGHPSPRRCQSSSPSRGLGRRASTMTISRIDA